MPTAIEPAFAPVIVGDRCLGHLLRSAKGYRAFDRNDREVGTFLNVDAAIAALASGREKAPAFSPGPENFAALAQGFLYKNGYTNCLGCKGLKWL
jgi:hypothetical protein